MAGEQTKFTTSFIPKKPVTPTVSGYKTTSNFLNIIMVAIFLGTVCFAVFLFAYKIIVEKRIDAQIENLKKSRNEFDENFIKEATRLNTRLMAIKKLIDGHQAPSAVFDLLQERTLETIRFNNLTYATEKTKGTISIDAAGVGLGYESIVLQSDEFGRTGSLKDVVFSSVQETETGLVNFSLGSQIDPAIVLYRKTLATETSSDSDDVSFNNNIFR